MIQKLVKALELKLPPVIVVAIFAGLTALARHYDVLMFRNTKLFDIWVIIPLVVGFGIALLGVIEFKKASTTVDPTNPEKASNLVNSGVFKFTRNPMYVGMIFSLIGLAIYMGTWVGFANALLCAAYLTQFQIIPEERVIENLFGDAYREYKNNVRRWF